jgi:hypothetical protein
MEEAIFHSVKQGTCDREAQEEVALTFITNNIRNITSQDTP